MQHIQLADMNHSSDTGEGLSHTILCGILSPGVITNTILVVAYVTLLFAACVEDATVIYLMRTYKDLRQSTFNMLIITWLLQTLLRSVSLPRCLFPFVCWSTMDSWFSWKHFLQTCLLHITGVHRAVHLHARYYVC